jgi:hypothetical protein
MLNRIALFAVLFLTNCTSPSPSNFMALDEVDYVQSFPQTFSLENGLEPPIDIIGIKSFAIYDSLLIFSTTDKEGLWSFLSLPDYNFLDKFLTVGQGPFEFAPFQAPSVDNITKFSMEDNQIFACIYDFHRNHMCKMDVNKSLSTNELQISLLKEFPPSLFNITVIDSTKFLCKGINDNQTQQLRYIIDGKDTIISDFMQRLNQPAIREGEDINILSTITKYSDDHQLVVEMPIGLNYINMYSLDSSFGKTICMGKTLDDINKIQNKQRFDRIYTYAHMSLFEDFFGIVRINEDEKTYQTKRTKLPSILLFDWQGTPLAELKLNRFITSFDIDFNDGYLYTLDIHSDEFYRYDIKNILTKLNKTVEVNPLI